MKCIHSSQLRCVTSWQQTLSGTVSRAFLLILTNEARPDMEIIVCERSGVKTWGNLIVTKSTNIPKKNHSSIKFMRLP